MSNQRQNPNDLITTKPSHRMAKVNAHIKRLFGEIIQKEADLPADSLVTISNVETSDNLRSATVWLSILPIETSTKVMKMLKPQLYYLQGELNRKLHMHPLPRIKLAIDRGAEYADKIDHKLAELD